MFFLSHMHPSLLILPSANKSTEYMATVSSKKLCKRHSSFFSFCSVNSSFSCFSPSSRVAPLSSSSPLRFFRSFLFLFLLLIAFFSSLASCWYVQSGEAKWLHIGYPSSVLIIATDYAIINIADVEIVYDQQTGEEPDSSYSSSYSPVSSNTSPTSSRSSWSYPFLKATTTLSAEELRVEPISDEFGRLLRVYPGSHADGFVFSHTNFVTVLDDWRCSLAFQRHDQISGDLHLGSSGYSFNNVVVALRERVDYSCGLVQYDEALSTQNSLVFWTDVVNANGFPFMCYPKHMEYQPEWLLMNADDLPDNVWRIQPNIVRLAEYSQRALVVGLSVGLTLPVFLLLVALVVCWCRKKKGNVAYIWDLPFKRRPKLPLTMDTKMAIGSSYWADLDDDETMYAGTPVSPGVVVPQGVGPPPKVVKVDVSRVREHHAKESIGGESKMRKKTL
eukprot:GHVS01024125.1.p1 GENE.GHVS01024125.1~~GHVS01024125.1.p1  ORF type:complete len:446 (+),score=65.06 GHVS01024125.1:12-1349(+)